MSRPRPVVCRLLPLLGALLVVSMPLATPGQPAPAPRAGTADAQTASDGPQEYFHERGSRMLQRGAWRAAARQFRLGIQNTPDAAGPWAGLALAQCQLEELEQAREDAERAQDLDPHQPLVHTAMACLLQAEGDAYGALERLEMAADGSRMPTYTCRLVSHLIQQGQYREAAAALEPLVAAGHRGRTVAALRARCRLAMGDLDLADQDVEEVRSHARNIRSGLALELLAELARDRLDRRVVEPFPYLVAKSGASDEIVVFRAEGMRRLGLLDDAEHEAARRKRDSDDPLGSAMLVRLACDTGALDDAEAALAAAQQVAPMHPSLLLSEAYLRVLQGETDAAARALDLARAVGVPAWDRAVEEDLDGLIAAP